MNILRDAWIGLAIFVIAIVLAVETFRWLRLRRRRKQSLGWPIAEAAGQKGHIKETSGPDVTWYLLNMLYSYKVGELQYSGWYTEEFDSLELAQLARITLAERRLQVRYNPSDPADSFMDPYRDY